MYVRVVGSYISMGWIDYRYHIIRDDYEYSSDNIWYVRTYITR
jgi:hypothetical protein